MKTFDHRKYRPTPPTPLRQRQWPGRVIASAPRWVSVDLRDGNQALLEPMSVAQKKRLWSLLLKLGFKEIEIGFPSASQADFDFVRELIEKQQIPDDVTVQVLVPAREPLIARTFEALRGVRRAIVHVYNSTSKVQRERVFGKDRTAIKAIARQGARWVQQQASQQPATDWRFQYSPESFTATEMAYAVEVCEAVLEIWQPSPEQPCIINLPATVELATPNVFADQVEYFATHISRRDSIILSVHAHNDRGCAVAASELALLAGADRVEGTLLGNGERTGNLDILTLAMNLYSQGIDPQLDLSDPDEIIRVVAECTGMTVGPRHPWVGELVYTAFSGSHQDAISKCLRQQRPDEPWQVAYLPIDPRDIGRDYQAVIRVNSQSGKGGMAFVLERDYGLSLPRWLQIELARQVQAASEARGGEIDSAEIHALLLRHFVADQAPAQLQSYQLERRQQHDLIKAELSIEGQTHCLQGIGEGAMSAFVDAWRQHNGQPVRILDYQQHAVGAGTDAEAVAYVLASINGFRVGGVAFDHDTVSAALKALLSALNLASSQQQAAA